MPEHTAAQNGRLTSEEVPAIVPRRQDEALRKFAVERLENVRKFKRYLWVYLLSMLVLTPVWVITQYDEADGWLKHLSSRSRYPGDWDPWLIWVGLVGAFIVGVAGYRAYFDRPETEEDIEREIARLKTKR